MGARIVAVGEPVNDAERRVIAHLRDHGHDDWTVLHTVEIPRRGGLFEVDLVVVTGHAVYVIDVKGTRGRVEVDGGRWHPEGRSPFRSPLPKLRGNAKKLKGLLEDQDARLSRVYTHALVVLTGHGAELVDHSPNRLDGPDAVTLADLVTRLADVARVPVAGRPVDADISSHHTAIVDLVRGSSRAPSGPLRFGNWQVIERLSESQRAPGVDVLDEYRAKNASAVQGSGTVRLSVRAADSYASETERRQQQRQIGVAYEALGKLPAHPHVVGVRDFFPWDDESAFVTVYDDVPGHALRLHLSGGAEPLTADAKLRTIRHVLMGLAHAHRRRIVHRELSPSTVLIAQDGRAMLTGFDYAKTAQRRAHTVAQQAHAAAETAYLAPECHTDPSKMGAAADIYAVGVIGFELLTGRRPFVSVTSQVRAQGRLPESELRDAGVRVELAHWLQTLCAADPARRPVASEALRRLDLAMGAARGPRKRLGRAQPRREETDGSEVDGGPRGSAFFKELPEGFQLGTKYIVKRRLGHPGGFGVAYRVYDSIRNVERAVKIVLHDQDSPMERLRREFSVLERLEVSPHPNVVSMVDADRLPTPDPYPYLVFEFVDGKDVGEVIRSGKLSPADVLRLGIDTARGLEHIHRVGVWHCDIKPSNLLWTDGGVKLLDFGIAKTADTSQGHTSGSPAYTPPDLDEVPADGSGYADRDLYALGITMYQALTGGQYPWRDTNVPPPGKRAPDPRQVFSDLGDLAPGLVETLLRAVSPYRAERYTCAEELLGDLEKLGTARVRPSRKAPERSSESGVGPPKGPAGTAAEEQVPPNTNPYVTHLQTLYSQSRRSNRGTRGLDPHAMMVYVETALDRALIPALREGRHALVIITGNAGDGKTAFLEHFERKARDLGAEFGPARPNGSDFTLQGRDFRTNHDGSQDEGEATGDEVLEDFFSPYTGSDDSAWTGSGQTRMIAVNEGRLVDFLSHRKERFARLAELVETGLAGGVTPDAVAVVNLNTRDVTARPTGPDGTSQDGESILERMVDRMTSDQFWEACASCDLAASCYARHNALSLGHPDAGPQVTRRLRRIYELTRLRGQLHITLRDLRSALAYTLTSGRDCEEIHRLYAEGDPRPILDGYYFSAHLGSSDEERPERDRLLRRLREADVAAVPQPQLDRRLDYTGLLDDRALVSFDERPDYDRKLLMAHFEQLGRSTTARPEEVAAHRRHLDAARRLLYFELYDDERAQRMSPHPSALRFLELLASPVAAAQAREELLHALNRGEGLAVPDRVQDALALQMRDVPGGTVRSFRLFPAAGFTLEPEVASASSYVESSSSALLLRYQDPEGRRSARIELRIGLDLFELLQRFAKGYRPGIADMQGRQLALSVFKNTLAAVPYQEIVLTAHGRDLHRIRRTPDHVLHMEDLTAHPAAEAQEEIWH